MQTATVCKLVTHLVHRGKQAGPVSEGDLDAFSNSLKNQKKRKRTKIQPDNLTWAGGWNEYAKLPSAKHAAAEDLSHVLFDQC